MNRMFTISDRESETADDAAESEQSRDELTESDMMLSEPADERPRPSSDSRAPTENRGEGGDWPGGAVFEEDGGADGTGSFRTRSRSAPPELWAAMRYGRQLRRMSDDFDTLVDKLEMRKLQKSAATKSMRPSFSWFSFWRRKDPDVNGSATDSRSDD